MSTAKHTPGPWQANPTHVARENDGEIVIEQNGGSAPIAVCRPINTTAAGPAQILANARLIAAAPDLLAALKLAYRELNGGDDSLSATEHAEAFRLARAAIAWAEGRDE